MPTVAIVLVKARRGIDPKMVQRKAPMKPEEVDRVRFMILNICLTVDIIFPLFTTMPYLFDQSNSPPLSPPMAAALT